jgi:hypothetical protein
MPDVFDGPADGRQSTDQAHPTSRFRPRYRALSDGEKYLHDSIKAKAEELERLFEKVTAERAASGHGPAPREGALAMTKLEEAIMWAVKGLTA